VQVLEKSIHNQSMVEGVVSSILPRNFPRNSCEPLIGVGSNCTPGKPHRNRQEHTWCKELEEHSKVVEVVRIRTHRMVGVEVVVELGRSKSLTSSSSSPSDI